FGVGLCGEDMNLLAAQRRASISSLVSKRGAITISELAEQLQVSEMTVRRDIDSLEGDGLVRRVHGGVTSTDFRATTAELPFTENLNKRAEAKAAIAKEAVRLVKPGDSLALLGGSTVYSLAQELLSVANLTIVTNSIPISNLFMSQQQANTNSVYVSGGTPTPTDSLIGNLAVSAFGQFNFDVVFMGSLGMDLEAGFSAPSLVEAETNRAIMLKGKLTALLVDNSKWGVKGFSSFAKLSEADVLVTDAGLGESAREELKSKVGRLLVAGER
ncbi:MAG TPA: DeoR/GlpR family DNA-binding transcription regulator, partial [Microbacteriaceae bacterium]